MSKHTYKKVELVGSSSEGIQQAIESAITKARETIRNMRWFDVVETRGQIEDGKVSYWQVTVKVGFRIDD